MIKIIDLILAINFYAGLLLLYAFIGFIIFMIIQLISYRIFKFNLYRFLEYHLFTKYL